MSDAEMHVIKRNNKIEEISFDKILQRVKKLGNQFNLNIPYSTLVMKVIDQLYHHGKSRWTVAGHGHRFGACAHRGDDFKSPRTHGAFQSIAEGSVIINDQQSLVVRKI